MQFESDKKYIGKLLGGEEYKFLIPLYQRPYRWDIGECETLLDDILDVFNGNEENDKEYFLGSIVAYKSEKSKDLLEIIDGQQRLTTLTLLFRAIYESFKQDETEYRDYLRDFGKCLWNYSRREVGFEFSKPHLQSEVITDEDLKVLKCILNEDINSQELEKSKSLYAKNYLFFDRKLRDFRDKRAMKWKDFCDMLLGKHFFVLLVICDSQDSAMTIFNTLNSRGKPLSNADIIKGNIYKKTKYAEKFAEEWRELESKIEENDKCIDSMDFLFAQLMCIVRAEKGDTDTTLTGLLGFFTKKDKKRNDKYHYRDVLDIDNEDTMSFLARLADFWIAPKDYLSDKSLMYMHVLNYFPNASWKPFVSCLVWKYKEGFDDENINKEDLSKKFEKYLVMLIKYVTLQFLNNKTETKSIQHILFKLNTNILNNNNLLENIDELEQMPIFESFYSMFKKGDAKKAKYLLLLYAYICNDFRELIDCSHLEVEHILPRQWQSANFDGWDLETHKEYIEQIGNKILLDRKSNIKCSDHFFAKKQDNYKNVAEYFKEVKDLGTRKKNKWDKEDIEQRNQQIYDRLKEFLKLKS